jgi:BirA family transcriptional regulator, biotin operon repressor / biotin---[acetyl-CoA-carboxylase] ligase
MNQQQPSNPQSDASAASAAPSMPVLSFPEVESTSGLARKLAETGQLRGRPAMVVAETQSGGVGRFKRQWQSPRGGLWCTLAWPLPADPAGNKLMEGLGLRVGVVCTQLVARVLAPAKHQPDVRLKWPNDVLVNDRKIAGVLCELVPVRASVIGQRYVLIGVGINANLSDALLPAVIRERSTGFLDHIAREVDLVALRERLQSELIAAMETPGLPAGVLSEARRLLWGVGRPAAVALPGGQRVTGMFVGIDDRGLAKLKTDDGLFVAPPGTMLLSGENQA